jgi:5-formyltetrahydrofolate cyclo-ligase
MLHIPALTDEHARAEALRELARKQIRTRQRAVRAAHPAAALARRSEVLCERVLALDAYRRARGVALFWPLEHEVDLRRIDAAARAEGKAVYYPVLDTVEDGFRSGFALSADAAELAPQNSRFHEPPRDAPRAARGDIELVVVPALAIALSGHRLGYGWGFYDSVLPDVRPPAWSVVVAFDFQLLAELPVLAHDVACDWIVTDARSQAAEGPDGAPGG